MDLAARVLLAESLRNHEIKQSMFDQSPAEISEGVFGTTTEAAAAMDVVRSS